jgi:hypothetical protein
MYASTRWTTRPGTGRSGCRHGREPTGSRGRPARGQGTYCGNITPQSAWRNCLINRYGTPGCPRLVARKAPKRRFRLRSGPPREPNTNLFWNYQTVSGRVILRSSSKEVATWHTKICHVAYMICPVPALQSELSSSRAPSVPPPSRERPGFSLACAGGPRPYTNFAGTAFSEVRLKGILRSSHRPRPTPTWLVGPGLHAASAHVISSRE